MFDRPHTNWLIQRRGGPVLATAVHPGHELRAELRPYLAVDETDQRREEDPLTDLWATVGDDVFSCYNSRFEVDLNRPRDAAVATSPEATWGMLLWREPPPIEIRERSLRWHDCFYAMMRGWIEQLIATHGKVLVLDIHSYNHRRAGPLAPPAPQADNPDIDLGATTLDRGRFGTVLERLAGQLRKCRSLARELDVRVNVRYPDGGHWPEWIYASYGADVCTITLEYKKFFMDEWTGRAFLPVVDALRTTLREAVGVARRELAQCR